MTETTANAFDPSRTAAAGHNPWLIAFVVSIATFMEVLDTTIANVALQHIAGGLAAGMDEATWVITSYLVSNAIILSISGWLATVIGRKRFYMICVALFTISSLLCGLAWSLESLIVFRILQGLGGGGMAPSEQSILADSFPPEKRGQAFSVYGIAVVVAPIVGPTLGGWLTDNYSWHWVFLINVPMGILSLVLVGMLTQEPSQTEVERKKLLRGGLKIDFVGFALVAIGLGCLEVVLDKGQRDDWFSSPFIVTFMVLSAVSLLALIPWELSRREPIIDIRLLFQRQFGACFLVMFAVGAVLIATTQFLPQLLQTEFGYTATLAGMALSPGGMMTMCMMPIVGKLLGFAQPRYLLVFGAAAVAYSMYYLTSLDPNFSFYNAVLARVYMAIGLPFLFLAATNASYAGVPPEKTNQASALINVARNIGGSVGVGVSQTLLAQREQFHQSRLVENVIPSSTQYQDTLQRITDYFTGQGASAVDAAQQATARIGTMIAKQATLLSYIDVFFVLSLMTLVIIPLAFLLGKVEIKTRARQ